MVKKVLTTLIAVGALAGAVWLVMRLFPNDETKIRRVLSELAEAASMPSGEGNISKLSRVNRILGSLTPDVTIRFSPDGGRGVELNGRDEVQAVAGAAASGRSVVVDFIDVDVAPVSSGETTAHAELTAKVQITGERDFGLQALRVELQKDDEFGWRVKRLETFQPLQRD